MPLVELASEDTSQPRWGSNNHNGAPFNNWMITPKSVGHPGPSNGNSGPFDAQTAKPKTTLPIHTCSLYTLLWPCHPRFQGNYPQPLYRGSFPHPSLTDESPHLRITFPIFVLTSKKNTPNEAERPFMSVTCSTMLQNEANYRGKRENHNTRRPSVVP